MLISTRARIGEQLYCVKTHRGRLYAHKFDVGAIRVLIDVENRMTTSYGQMSGIKKPMIRWVDEKDCFTTREGAQKCITNKSVMASVLSSRSLPSRSQTSSHTV